MDNCSQTLGHGYVKTQAGYRGNVALTDKQCAEAISDDDGGNVGAECSSHDSVLLIAAGSGV